MEPLLSPIAEEESLEEDPSGQQHQWPVPFLPVGPSSAGSADQHLPQELQPQSEWGGQASTSGAYRTKPSFWAGLSPSQRSISG